MWMWKTFLKRKEQAVCHNSLQDESRENPFHRMIAFLTNLAEWKKLLVKNRPFLYTYFFCNKKTLYKLPQNLFAIIPMFLSHLQKLKTSSIKFHCKQFCDGSCNYIFLLPWLRELLASPWRKIISLFHLRLEITYHVEVCESKLILLVQTKL